MKEQDKAQLIDSLVEDLKPVTPVRHVLLSTQFWLITAVVLSAGMAWMFGPYRAGALNQLLLSKQFSLETLVGIIAIIALAIAGFRSAIPSAATAFKQRFWPISLLCAWLVFYLYGLVEPALAESTSGKRDHCYIETVLMSLLPLWIGLSWATKKWPVNPVQTGVLLGLASGLMSAMVMQFACMYDPAHALLFHVLPGLSVGVLGAFLAKKMMNKG
jgi:hypothetical protein